jgi:ribosomal protein S18 acetylase RimI-like enzyme
MNDTLTVRPGSPEELDSFSGFWLAMFEEVGKHSESDFPRDWRAGFGEYFRRRMSEGEAAFFVATVAGAIVGTAGALLSDGYPVAITQVKQGYIFGVRVAPEHRRRGIAERLTREAIAFLRRSDCKTIRLHASRFGRATYERLGFVATNEMELPALLPLDSSNGGLR